MAAQVKMLLTPQVKSIDVENRIVKFIGTKETKDRTGDIVEVNGWELDNYQKNPVFLWDHNPSIPPIGRALSIVKEGLGLVFSIEFAKKEVNEFADTIFKLFKEGFLNAVSVGFIPKQYDVIRDSVTEDIVGLRFTRQELLELSAVSIPAHPDALSFNGDKEMSEAYQRLMTKSMEHPKEKSLIDVEVYSKSMCVEIAKQEGEDIMKEEFEQLQKEVAELKTQVASLITLKESVELSKSVLDSFNKHLVASLKNQETTKSFTTKKDSEDSVGTPVGQAFDPDKLMSLLDGLGKRISEKSFKLKGE